MVTIAYRKAWEGRERGERGEERGKNIPPQTKIDLPKRQNQKPQTHCTYFSGFAHTIRN